MPGLNTIVRIALVLFFLHINAECISQYYFRDSSSDKPGIQNAIETYHNRLSPENGLYNGSEYAYNQYYPFKISEGYPFFLTRLFMDGSVLYDGIEYRVPLLFDIVKGELLIHDPSKRYYVKLNSERVESFTLQNYTFVHLRPDTANTANIREGFYALLYNGPVSLYESFVKTFKTEMTVMGEGASSVIEREYFFIRKNNQYFRIRNKKTLLAVLNDRRKDIQRFIRTNKLNMRKNKEYAFIKIIDFYNGINQHT